MQRELPSWAISQNTQEDFYDDDSHSEKEEQVVQGPPQSIEANEEGQMKPSSDGQQEAYLNPKTLNTHQEVEQESEGQHKLLQTAAIAGQLDQWMNQYCPRPPFFVPKQKFYTEQQKIALIIHHLMTISEDEEFSNRLNIIMNDLMEGQTTIYQAFGRLTAKELEMMLCHRIFLQCMEEKVALLIEKVQRYRALAFCNFNEIIRVAYRLQPEEIDFPLLEKKIFNIMKRSLSEYFKKTEMDEFAERWIKHVRRQYRFRIYQLKRTVQIEGRVISEDSGSSEEQDQTQFDKVSTYGLFNSIQQEKSLNSDGIYNYRLHRTINFMKREKMIDPAKNPQMAKDYAIFLIKLTDLHLTKLLKKAVVNSKLSLQNKVVKGYKGVWDEFSYFSKRNHPEDDDSLVFDVTLSKQDQCGVWRCPYPYSLLAHYAELRHLEVLRQNRVYQIMYPEICITLGCSTGKNSRYEDLIDNYFKTADHDADTVKQYLPPRTMDRPKMNKLTVQIEHFIAAIEEEKCYEDSQLLQRLRFTY